MKDRRIDCDCFKVYFIGKMIDGFFEVKYNHIEKSIREITKIVHNLDSMKKRRIIMESKVSVDKMKFVMLGESLRRVEIIEDENGSMVVSVDVHGLRRGKAYRIINNIIAITRNAFLLNVIHGYHKGTALKDMVMEDELNSRVSERKCPLWNPGQTFLTVLK